jgi:hypothetical protein
MKKIVIKNLTILMMLAMLNLISFGQTAERIKVPKGKTDAEISGNLAPKKSKKYVAGVGKGLMICIMPGEDVNAKITVKLDGKLLDLAENGPCSEHTKKAGDHTIEIGNSGTKALPFTFTVGFYEHG